MRRTGRSALHLGAVACAVALAVSGCGLLPSEPVSLGSLSLKIPPQPPPATVTVERGTVALTVQIAGVVTATRHAELYFPVAGRLATLAVHNGQQVAAGQVLATLDSGDLRYQIDSARLAVEQDRLHLAGLRLAQAESPPTTAVAAAQAAVALEQADLALAHDTQSLQALEHAYAQERIVAPFAGVVQDIANSPGDQIPAFTPVMDISDPRHEALVADIDSQTAGELRVGTPVAVTLNGTRREYVQGVVSALHVPSQAEIQQVEESTNGNVVLSPTVTVALRGVRGPLPIGETWSGYIVLAQARDVLYVPSDVVRQLGGGSYVDVYRGGVISQVRVTTGLVGDTDTAVLSGLHQGEQIVEP